MLGQWRVPSQVVVRCLVYPCATHGEWQPPTGVVEVCASPSTPVCLRCLTLWGGVRSGVLVVVGGRGGGDICGLFQPGACVGRRARSPPNRMRRSLALPDMWEDRGAR